MNFQIVPFHNNYIFMYAYDDKIIKNSYAYGTSLLKFDEYAFLHINIRK